VTGQTTPESCSQRRTWAMNYELNFSHISCKLVLQATCS